MKEKIKILLFIGLLMQFACQKEEPLKPTTTPNIQNINILNPSFSADLDSFTFVPNSINASTDGTFMNVVGRILLDSLGIVTKSTKPGTYRTIDDGINTIYYYSNGRIYSSAFVSTPNAEITISSYDEANNVASGSFKGSIKDIGTQSEIVVRNGKFIDIKLRSIPAQVLGTMTARVNTRPFDAYFCGYVENPGLYQISGSSTGANETITLQFDSQPKVGTISLDGINNSATYTENTSGPNPSNYISNNGTVVIQSINQNDKIIKGTFNFSATNFATLTTVDITDGKFEATFN